MSRGHSPARRVIGTVGGDRCPRAVVPLARAVKYLGLTSADFGFLSTSTSTDLRRSGWSAHLAMTG